MTDLVQNLKIGNTAYGIVSVKDCLTGSSDPTTATAGYVGQRYLNTTNNKVFVCTAVIPHRTFTNTHYTTSGGSWSYDGNTGELTATSSNCRYVKISPSVSITNKPVYFIGKFRVNGSGGFWKSFVGNSNYATIYQFTYGGGSVVWVRLSVSAGGTAKASALLDNGYTRDTLPSSGWSSSNEEINLYSSSGAELIWGGTEGHSALASNGSKLYLADSYAIIDGVTYNLVDVETTYTYTWNQQASTADLSSKQNTLTAGDGISISSDTVAATAMTGADGANAGTLGAVPAPAATDNTKFLRGDGTWAEVGSTSYNPTTQEITLG